MQLCNMLTGKKKLGKYNPKKLSNPNNKNRSIFMVCLLFLLMMLKFPHISILSPSYISHAYNLLR